MPLFIDFHKFDEISIEKVKEAHLADIEIQAKYNVKYHQFWVNEEEGMVFCLIEAPDQESCETVHKEAHGDIACNITKVEPGFFELVMGSRFKLDNGLVLNKEGANDKAFRHLLCIDLRGVTSVKTSRDYKKMSLTNKPRSEILNQISNAGGKYIESANGKFTAIFSSSSTALRCALKIREGLLSQRSNRVQERCFTFRISLHTGFPLTLNEDFFEKAMNTASRLISITSDSNITLSSDFVSHFEEPGRKSLIKKSNYIRIFSKEEEKFMSQLFSIAEKSLHDHNLNVSGLSRRLGTSRAQLYRKMVSLSGQSPNEFLRMMRMEKAMEMIREKSLNISEISLEVGYKNPSYFSKVFQEYHGIIPSGVISSGQS